MEKHSHFVRCEVDYLWWWLWWFVYKFIRWSCELFEVTMMMMKVFQVLHKISFPAGKCYKVKVLINKKCCRINWFLTMYSNYKWCSASFRVISIHYFMLPAKKGLLLMDWTIEKKSILKSTFNNFISLPSLTISFHLFLSSRSFPNSFSISAFIAYISGILQFVINLIAPDIVKSLEKSIILCKAINHVSYSIFKCEIFL